MPVEALCPTCGAVFNLKEEFQGKKVRCKKCEHVFTVGGEAKAREREEEESVRPTPAAAAPRKRAATDDDDDRPRKSASRRGRDDDDDRDSKSRKRKRAYDDDDDDDDRSRKRKSSGGNGGVIAIIAVAAVLLLGLIGGGAYGIYYLVKDDDTETASDDDKGANKKDDRPVNNPGGNRGGNNNNFGGNGGGNNPPDFGNFNPGGGQPDFGGGRQPADVKEALANLKAGNPPADRRTAADWLSREKVDPTRQKEVAKALEALVNDLDDSLCLVGARALKVWGSKENGEALTKALRHRLPNRARPFFGDAQKELMYALAQFKYEPGAEVVVEFLHDGFARDEAERVLDTYGPAAEKAVLKFVHHPDGATHDKARGLLTRYGTKPILIVDQTVIDLGSADKARVAAAVDWLANSNDSSTALQAADATRRKNVAVALNRSIEDPPGAFTEDNVIKATKRWGTRENGPALVKMLTKNPFKKQDISDVLVDLAKQPGLADDPIRAKTVSALLDGLSVPFPQGNDNSLLPVAKALVVWAAKDDGAAIADKLRDMHKFCQQSRKLLFDWIGKEKVEKAIPYLATALIDKDDYKIASQTLQAMGPELGEKIEIEVSQLKPTDPFQANNQLAECFKVLGAVGTEKSLNLLQTQAKVFQAKKDNQMVAIIAQAMAAIKGRM